MTQRSNTKSRSSRQVVEGAEKTAFVNGKPVEYKDPNELDRLKDNSDITSIQTAQGKTIKEQEPEQDLGQEEETFETLDLAQTIQAAKPIGKALGKAIRAKGDGIESATAVNIEAGTFDIDIVYENGNEKKYSFSIENNEIHLKDGEDDVIVGEIGIRPSGDLIVHVDTIAGLILNYFDILNEEATREQTALQAKGEASYLSSTLEEQTINTLQEVKSFFVKTRELQDSLISEDWGSSDQVAMNNSIHKTLGEPTEMPSPSSNQLQQAIQEAVEFYWEEQENFTTNKQQLAELATKNYLSSQFSEKYKQLQALFAVDEKGLYEDAIQKAIVRAAFENTENTPTSKHKYVIEVATKDSFTAIEHLDETYKNDYIVSEANTFSFSSLAKANQALIDLEGLQLTIKSENISEEINRPAQPIDQEFKKTVGRVVEGVAKKFNLNSWEALQNVTEAVHYIKEDFKHSSPHELQEKEIVTISENNVSNEQYKVGTLTTAIKNITEAVTKLQALAAKYDRKDSEIEFPYWLQQKVNISEDYVKSVADFLSFEDKKPAVDLLSLEEETPKPYQHHTIKEMIESVGKKAQEVYDYKPAELKEGKGKGSLKLKGGITVEFKKEYGAYSIIGGTLAEQIKKQADEVKVKLDEVVSKLKGLAKDYTPGDKKKISQLRQLAELKNKLEAKHTKILSSIER